MKDELLTISEAAQFFGVSTRTLIRWEEKGILKSVRTIGNQRRYSKSHLAELLRLPQKFQEPTPQQSFVLSPPPQPLSQPSSAPSPVKRKDHSLALSLAGGMLAGIGLFAVVIFGILFSPEIGSQFQRLNSWLATSHNNGDLAQKGVLAATDKAENFALKINVPAIFNKKATFLDSFEIKNSLKVDKESSLFGGINTNNSDINAGTGRITASNIIYSLLAGSNIAITGDPQNPTISAETAGVTTLQGQTGALALTGGNGISLNGLEVTNAGVLSVQGQTGAVTLTGENGISVDGTTISNSDKGSSQNIFKVITAGGTDISASSNNDQITFAAGSGITISGDAGSKTVTITGSATGLTGLTTNGVLYATSSTDATTLAPGTNGYILQSNGAGSPPSWVANNASNPPFSSITSGTNTVAAMIVGSGASLNFSGSGTINASTLGGATFAAPGAIGSVTPSSGAFTTITGSSFNGLTITNNGSNTLTIANGKTLTVNNSLTLAGTDGTSFTLPGTSGTLVTTAATQTLTNKTIAAGSNTITGLTNSNLSGSAGITNANLANSSLTVTAGTGLSGGGAVSLGGTVTLNNAGVTSAAAGSGISIDQSTGNITITNNGVTSAVAGAGIGLSGGTGAVTITNNGVTSLAGTTNQIAVSGGTGAITLSLPQNIHSGASPTFTGLILSGFTNNGGVVYTNGTGTFAQTSVGALGECLQSSGGGAPTWGPCIGTSYFQRNSATISPAVTGDSLLLADSGNTSPFRFEVNGRQIGKALVGLNETGDQDIFTASSSGTTRFTINNNGNLAATGAISGLTGLTSSGSITFSALTTNGGLLYTNGSGAVAQTSAGSLGQCLTSNGGGTPTWGSCAATNYWQSNGGTVSPVSNTLDLLVGGTSTASAKFAFINANSGTPTASISANSGNNATYLSGDGILTTTNARTLTLGSASNGDIAFRPGGVAAGNSLYLGSNGNVGIGTSAPGYNLEIAGNTSSSSVGVLPGMRIINTNTSGNSYAAIDLNGGDGTAVGRLQINGNASNPGMLLYTSTATPLAFGTSNAERARFTSNGDFIINGTNALATLDVRGRTGTTPVASFSGASAQASLIVDNSGVGDIFAASSSGLNRFVIKQNGNIGIGDSDPTHNLDIVHNQDAVLHLVADLDNAGSEADNAYILLEQDGGINDAVIGLTGVNDIDPGGNVATGSIANSLFLGTLTVGQDLELATRNTVRMRIDDNGNIGIGTGANTPLAALDVRGITSHQPAASISGNTSFAGLVVDNNGTGDLFTASSSGTTRFTINNAGNVVALGSITASNFSGSSTGTNTGDITVTGQNYLSLAGQQITANAINLSGSNVTSTLGIGNGGTGVTGTPTNGQLLIGNGSGYALATLTQGTGIGISNGSGTISITNNGVTQLTGTTNQVNVSGSTGAITLSLPQSIHTGATPTFASLILSALSNNGGVLYTNGSGTVAQSASGIDGQFLSLVSGTPTWTTANTLSFFQRASGTMAPLNITDDLIIGGAATASAKFQISGLTGNASSAGNLTFSNAASIQTTSAQTLTIGGTTTGDISFRPGGSTSGSSLYLASNGRVGLGTSAPNAALHIRANSNASVFSTLEQLNSGTSARAVMEVVSDSATGGFAAYSSSFSSTLEFADGVALYAGNAASGGLSLVTDAAAPIKFVTHGVERMRLDNNGNLGIGTTNALATLDVRSNSATTPAASVAGNTNFASMVVDQADGGDIFTASKSGASKFTIKNNGDVQINNLANCPAIQTDANGTLTCGGTGDTATFTDTTTETLGDANTNIWDGTQPNMTPRTTSNTLLVTVNVYVNENTSPLDYETNVFTIRRETNGTDATCTDTQVGNKFTAYTDGDQGAARGNATATFLDSPGVASEVRYTVCSDTDSDSDGTVNNTSPDIRFTIVQLGADLAENYYTTDDTLEPGHIVSIDSQLPAGAKKSTKAYDNSVLGIFSTAPGKILDDKIGDGFGRPIPIALSGRVPVKVSTESGAIKPGDYITSSSTPAVGMKATKAGRVVGQAMTGFEGEGIGAVMVFVNNTWYYGAQAEITDAGNIGIFPKGEVTQLAANELGEIPNVEFGIKDSSGQTLENIGAFSNAVVGNLRAGLIQAQELSVAGTLRAQRLEVDGKDVNKRLDDLEREATGAADVKFTALNEKIATLEASLQLLASGSALFGPSNGSAYASGEDLGLDTLDVRDATISKSLSVLGRTMLSDVGITGNLNIGLLSINGLDEDGSVAINTSAGPLKLQSLGLNGIDILNGKLTIDAKGNLVSKGEITAKKVNIDTKDVASASLGQATLEAGKSKVVIETKAVTSSSKIFVTARTKTSQPLSVTTQDEGKSFTVEVDGSSAKDVKFDWWIVN